MTSRPTDRVVKRGSFFYDNSVRCDIQIIQTDFRPGSGDDEAPVEDAYGDFYEIRYFWPGEPSRAGGGYYDRLVDAITAVEAKVKQVIWE